MTVDPAPKRHTGLPMPALLFLPPAAAALAYVGDIVFGPSSWRVAFLGGTGVQAFVVITAIFCALEWLVIMPIYLRNGRYTHAAAMTAYLIGVALVIFWLGSFHTK